MPSLILDVVDPPIPATKQPPISEDLQKALGAIERGVEQRMELLKGRKRELEAGSKEDMKPVLGHIEMVETEQAEVEEKDEEGEVQDRPRKRRATQSIVTLKDERQKQFMADQERRWLELTGGRYGPRPKPKASASLWAPVRSATATSTGTTTAAAVSSTTEAGEEIDLEEAMQVQEEEEGDYGRKYKTTLEDRT